MKELLKKLNNEYAYVYTNVRKCEDFIKINENFKKLRKREKFLLKFQLFVMKIYLIILKFQLFVMKIYLIILNKRNEIVEEKAEIENKAKGEKNSD